MQRGHRAGRRRVPAQPSTPGMSRAGGALPVPGARTPGQSSPARGKVWGPGRGRVQPLARQGRAGRGSVGPGRRHKSPRSETGAHRSPHGRRCAPLCVCVIHCVPESQGTDPDSPGQVWPCRVCIPGVPGQKAPTGTVSGKRTARGRGPSSPKLLIQMQPERQRREGGPHTNRPACVAHTADCCPGGSSAAK